jgi:hypothetical protein
MARAPGGNRGTHASDKSWYGKVGCQGPGKKNKVVPETLKFDEEARTRSFGRCTEIDYLIWSYPYTFSCTYMCTYR